MHGREQTEIDAALALAPQWLERTIIDTMSRFYDGTLEARVRAARDEWIEKAEEAIENSFGDELERMKEEVELINQMNSYRIDAINDQLDEMTSSIDLPPAFVPDANISEDDGRKVLIDSRWSWFEQTRRLKNRKAYVDDNEDGQ